MEETAMASVIRNKDLNWASKTILIVEDDPVSMELMIEILRETGAQLIKAYDGEEAISLSIEHNVDLVLLDIMLPEINGYAALKEIRKHKSNLPVIAQTAYAMTSDKARCLEAGCNDFISKPIDSEELYRKIKHCISSN